LIVRVQFDVRDWETAPEAESFYAENNSGLNGVNKLQRMIYPTMGKIDTTPGSIDWYDGYVTDWGIMNNVVVVHSGYGAELGPSPCLSNEPPQQRIWSQGTAASTEGWTSKDFFSVNGIAFASAVRSPKCDGDKEVPAKPAGMGIIAHEFLHTFGLIDLYDKDPNDKRIPLGGTGRYDMYVHVCVCCVCVCVSIHTH
jgi:M6 family metalloprotease-like protein